jgi:hypothetical protein
MKKVFYVAAISAMISAVTSAVVTAASVAIMLGIAGCADSKTPIAAENLSGEIKAYLAANFADQKVVQAIKEREDGTTSYEVLLDNALELSFTDKGEIREIESKNEGVVLPDAVIMPNILAYVRTNYPDVSVVAWELDDNKNNIKLNTDIELEFDKAGNFIRIDD